MTILKIKIAGLTAIALLLVAFSGAHGAGIQEDTLHAPTGTAQAFSAYAPTPESVKIKFLTQPSAVSAEEKKLREEILKKTHLPGPLLQHELNPQENIFASPSGASGVTNPESASGNFTIFKNSTLTAAIPGESKSTVNEPSSANSGSYVFYTGNWYAARSTDGGSTFSYIDPYADMPSFCCDQDVLYEQSRDIFIWYRQGVADTNGVNFFRLGVSNDKGATWYFYNFYPTDVNNTWTNQWWDYPRLALSNNYLYIAPNMFDKSDTWTRTVLLRFPIDALKAHADFNFDYIPWTSNFNFAPVSGAASTMYWGTHQSTSTFRLFSWDESSTGFNFYDRTIPAWTYQPNVNYSCPGPDGYNWCARSDERVISGWVANGTIGFFWNVMQGNGFPYPYINAATFKESDTSYSGRPYIWNSTYAFMYGDAAPDSRSHLGISLSWGGGSYYPSHAVGIDDDYNGAPPPWELVKTTTGTNGPGDSQWGDYVRARVYYPSGLLWTATGYTLQGGSTGNSVDPRYIVFGRERDNPVPPLYVSVSESPDPVTSGGNSLLSVHVTTTGGTPVIGTNVSISATGGSLNPTNGTTDANGNFMSNYTAPVVTTSTNYIISAVVSRTGYTDGSVSDSITVNPAPSFDTSPGTYPSISGVHRGNITLNQSLTITRMYTYPSPGTGGHSEYAAFYYPNGTLAANGSWSGYQGDWHNITFAPFTLEANVVYNYTIRTGSYPRIIHKNTSYSIGAINGSITSIEFIDANGKRYSGWIPAIRLE